MPRIPNDDSAPELDNDEQREADQAQDVADDAMNVSTDISEESEHGGTPDRTAVMPDDVPDLVDTMNQMVRSGNIDNGAFAGEPMHDDEEDRLGITDDDRED
ncbi:MAG: hypothetical protein V4618_17505 [Pseudomonadota bacterium]